MTLLFLSEIEMYWKKKKKHYQHLADNYYVPDTCLTYIYFHNVSRTAFQDKGYCSHFIDYETETQIKKLAKSHRIH